MFVKRFDVHARNTRYLSNFQIPKCRAATSEQSLFTEPLSLEFASR